MKRRAGLATIATLVALTFLAISLTAISYKASGSTGTVTAQEQNTKASSAADAGLQRAILTFRQVHDDWNKGTATASADWSWVEAEAGKKKFQKLPNDDKAQYSVSIHIDDEKGALVTDLNNKPAATTTYCIVSVGKSIYGLNEVTSTVVGTVTVHPGSKGGAFKYIVDTIRKAEGQIATLSTDKWKWIREPGLKYTADSWNGLAELLLQEGASSKITKDWMPNYEVVTKDKHGNITSQTGNNWAYGNNRTDLDSSQLKNWFLNNQSELAYKDFLNTYFDLSKISESEINALFKNQFISPNKDYYLSGTPAVIGGMQSIYEAKRTGDFATRNYPPFVALTKSSDYNPQTMFKTIQDIKKSSGRYKWSEIWPVLGSIIVYRDESKATDPKNPIYIYEIHVEQLASSPYTISDVYIYNPLTGKKATTLDDVKEPDHNNPSSTTRAVEVIYFTPDGTYPK